MLVNTPKSWEHPAQELKLRILVSCFLHLESEKPLFNRIVAMGGTPLLLKPVPITVAGGIYNIVMERLGLEHTATADERARALKKATVEELVAAAGNLPMLPIIDGELVNSPATFSRWSFQDTPFPGTEWCESVMIGDCEMDVSTAANHHTSYLRS